jgi:hypothetical protein
MEDMRKTKFCFSLTHYGNHAHFRDPEEIILKPVLKLVSDS